MNDDSARASLRYRSCVLLRVTDCEPLADYHLRVTFNDGSQRVVDLHHVLETPLGRELRGPAVFAAVRVDPDARTIVWPNGLDYDPDVLHGDFERAGASPPSRR